MFYTVYKVTNNINNKIYIGVHRTVDIDDGYMGSGKLIKSAIQKYGIENFTKEILEIFDNEADMFRMEAELVNEEFVNESTNYNIRIGGDGGWSHLKDYIIVKDRDGKMHSVTKNDPRYLSGELVHNTTGLVTVKDKNGKTYSVTKDDPRYLSGELVHNWCNKTHTTKTRRLIGSITSKHQSGTGNSQYGTVWIYSLTERLCKKIKKEDLQQYIDMGWVRGIRRKFD